MKRDIGGPTGDDPPFYRYHVFVCGNERPADHPRGCCKAKGSEKIRNYLKARVKELGLKDIRINQAGCLERCELGPCIVVYPDGVWYQVWSIADAERIVDEHLGSGRVVERLRIHLDGRIGKLENEDVRQVADAGSQRE